MLNIHVLGSMLPEFPDADKLEIIVPKHLENNRLRKTDSRNAFALEAKLNVTLDCCTFFDVFRMGFFFYQVYMTLFLWFSLSVSYSWVPSS